MQNRTGLLLITTLVGLALHGCGKSNDAGAPVEAKSVAPSTASDAAKPVAEKQEAAGLIIRVLQEDSDAGVAAEIRRLDDSDKTHFVADVDDSGIAKIKQPCHEGDRFSAEPRVDAFLSTRPQGCAETITFRLFGAKATFSLIQVADDAVRKGDFIVAQSNYGLAADRLRYAKPDEAKNLELRATTAAGKVLGVDLPTEVVNGQEGASKQMIDKLKVYQRSIKVPETGVLDAATRTGISKLPPAAILHEATTIQPTAEVPSHVAAHSTVNLSEIRNTQPTPETKRESLRIRRSVSETTNTNK